MKLEEIKLLSTQQLKDKLGAKYLSHYSLDVNRYLLASTLGYSNAELDEQFGNLNVDNAPNALLSAVSPGLNFTENLESRFWYAPSNSIPFIHPIFF